MSSIDGARRRLSAIRLDHFRAMHAFMHAIERCAATTKVPRGHGS
jgi:hypothetical protein